jgi:Flp pilus assembly protein TadD
MAELGPDPEARRGPSARHTPPRPSLGLPLIALLAAFACGEAPAPIATPTPTPPAAETPKPAYVGGQACAGCHPDEAGRWRGSHHDLAMQVANDDTILADASQASLRHGDEHFRFERRDGRLFVSAPDAEGERREFEVAYTFGVEPLQQYLVPLAGGRLQALGVAWDTRPASEGGQRWFHLHPEEPVPPGDVLHWTGPAGSWNAMCAECHSTNVSKGYDLAGDRYESAWSEIDVSCEACHGPGSAHVTWAETGAGPEPAGRGLVVDLGEERVWRFEAERAIARRTPARPSGTELDVCAPCHARRSRIAPSEPGEGFLDAYRPALLEEGLYHADGQILDEVFVWGSFVQSRMHAAGVTCSDCHDVHSLRVEEPETVCAGCHRAEVFATPAHHHHETGSAGASCLACHMPARNYMVVDARRDHAFQVPRPDQSVAIGVPNACTGCHEDRPVTWAADAAARWYGSERSDRTHYGEVLHAGRRRDPGAARALSTLSRDPAQAAIVRATALALLGSQLDPGSLVALERGLRDDSALVRMAAVASAESLPPQQRFTALEPLLRDPTRAVRIEAGRALAPWHREVSDPDTAGALSRALAEYRAAQALSADRPEAHVNLGLLHASLGDFADAEREYQAALRVGPSFVPAYVNLAELHRMRERDDEGERVLLAGLARVPESGALQHALGLLHVRQGRSEEALAALEAAARLEPASARFAYVYAVALHSSGARTQALTALGEAHSSHPGDPDLLAALATLHRDAGDPAAALRYARRLRELRPEDPATQALVHELEAQEFVED